MQINSHTHTHSTPATCHQQVNGANNKKIVDKKRTSINGKNTCSWSSTSRMSVCVCASRNGSLALPMHCPMVDRQQQQCVYLICQAKMPPAFYLCPPAIFPSIFVRERTWRERERAHPHTHTRVVSATEGANNNNENNNSYSWELRPVFLTVRNILARQRRRRRRWLSLPTTASSRAARFHTQPA